MMIETLLRIKQSNLSDTATLIAQVIAALRLFDQTTDKRLALWNDDEILELAEKITDQSSLLIR